MSISWLKLNYLSTVIPQTIINELLAGTVPLKNHLPELFQQKNKENISGAFNYSRRLLHTHACLWGIQLWPTTDQSWDHADADHRIIEIIRLTFSFFFI